MCPLPEYKGISMRSGLNARRTIDRDSFTQGLVRVRGGVRMWLLQMRPVAMRDGAAFNEKKLSVS